ncbi:MAG: hypothetical protein GQ526_00660, partial [Ardenticatenales bacterium]|nr:hypothetical protein [Ardenticatenales bacterium]
GISTRKRAAQRGPFHDLRVNPLAGGVGHGRQPGRLATHHHEIMMTALNSSIEPSLAASSAFGGSTRAEPSLNSMLGMIRLPAFF